MFKPLAIVLVTGIFAAAVSAQSLQVRVVTTGNASTAIAGNNSAVTVLVQAKLGGTLTDGLALVALNLKASGTLAGSVNLCDQSRFLVTAPTSPVDIKSHFDRNGGLTNPPGGPVSGFSGTCDGTDGLLQIGGAQNTIANSGSPVAYPSGTVLTGVGNGGYVTIASGTLVMPAAGSGTLILTPDTIIASVLNPGQTGPVYAVTRVPPENITITGVLTISTCGAPCMYADVNGDGTVNGGDILSVRAPGTWNLSGPPGWIRADVNNDGVVNGGDILSIRAPGTWNTSTAPCCF
jgi:hypothetical protein